MKLFKGFLPLGLLAALVAAPAFAQAPPSPVPASVIVGPTKALSVTTSSGNVQLPSTAPSADVATFYNSSSVDAFCTHGATNAVTATVNSPRVVAGTGWPQWIGSDRYIACITATGSTTVLVWQGNGPLQMTGGAGSGGGGGGTVTQGPAGSSPWLTTDSSTPATGVSQPTGGTGLQGWLSGIYNDLQTAASQPTTPVSGFAPGQVYASLTATGSSARAALPAGSTVDVYNTGTTAVSCTLGNGSVTAVANEDQIAPGGDRGFVVNANVDIACIDQTGSVSNVVAISGGVGLPTGSGGGGGTVTTSPTAVTPTDRGGTITLGGTAQTAAALNASRKQMVCENPVSATEDLYVAVSGSATVNGAGNLADLAPGGSVTIGTNGSVSTAAVSVNAATTNHLFLCTEFQ